MAWLPSTRQVLPRLKLLECDDLLGDVGKLGIGKGCDLLQSLDAWEYKPVAFID
jgi:hypothetical protein